MPLYKVRTAHAVWFVSADSVAQAAKRGAAAAVVRGPYGSGNPSAGHVLAVAEVATACCEWADVADARGYIQPRVVRTVRNVWRSTK